ncbi:MAG: DUF4391 domain-containing protein [Thalassovita sp.]
MLFAYPQAAKFGRVIPKNKIYEHADARAALKERFVAEVDQITWAYKLAPETINLGGSDAVPEIQVFQVKQRGDTLSEDVLRAMDRAIPFPILFELVSGAKRRTVAAFKRPNEGGKSKWVVSDYFWADWQEEGAEREALPVALDLPGLYDKFLTALMPVSPQQEEDIQALVDRVEAIRAKEKEVARIKTKLAKEKQFNRRVEINKTLRTAQQELAAMQSSVATEV